jgi:hypothetical protein
MNTVERDYIVDVCSGLPMAIFGNWKVDPPKGTRANYYGTKGQPPAWGFIVSVEMFMEESI